MKCGDTRAFSAGPWTQMFTELRGLGCSLECQDLNIGLTDFRGLFLYSPVGWDGGSGIPDRLFPQTLIADISVFIRGLINGHSKIG